MVQPRNAIPKASLLLALATGIALLFVAVGPASSAKAASCGTHPSTSLQGEVLGIEGGSCKDVPHIAEEFTVSCTGSPPRVTLRYKITDDPGETFQLGFPCDSMRHIEVIGYSGSDKIDLSAVTAAAGFSKITQANVISSGADADEVVGSSLPDSVLAGAGVDLIKIRHRDRDSVDCGTEFDGVQSDPRSFDSVSGCELVDALPEIRCGGANATQFGTPGADALIGTQAADVIAGIGGGDSIAGLGGNDVLCGGKGKDLLRGGKGRDRLLGGPARDRLRGGPGRDRLRGGPGRDRQAQ